MDAAEQYLYAHCPLPDIETTLEVEEAFQSFQLDIPDGRILPKDLEKIVQRGFTENDIGLLLYISECFRIDERYRAYAKRFLGAEGYLALAGARAYAEAGQLAENKEFREHYFDLAKKRCIEALEACKNQEKLAKAFSFETEEEIRGCFFPCYLASIRGEEKEYRELLQILAKESGGARLLYALALHPGNQIFLDVARGIQGVSLPSGTDYKDIFEIHDSFYRGKTRLDRIFHGIYLALSQKEKSEAFSILDEELLMALEETAAGSKHAFEHEVDFLYSPLYRLSNIVGNIKK